MDTFSFLMGTIFAVGSFALGSAIGEALRILRSTFNPRSNS